MMLQFNRTWFAETTCADRLMLWTGPAATLAGRSARFPNANAALSNITMALDNSGPNQVRTLHDANSGRRFFPLTVNE